ncbi:putative ribose-5-phosphate isomerase 3 [Hibiscus syriacus]|uniref:ribose-5-phosphate isomerase n=1 Tax=Hibiscus syriacus TaxID=106335 RepID=A0A6A2X714_HIBSY|nr:putative ribose-5-phosphate isomerase 3 [Hibiscus syriacus]
MILGLGTGSTAAFVVDKLGQLLSTGQLSNIIGIPTSKRTQEQAASLNIPLSTLDSHPHIDLAIDGADEVDPNLDLVKGRGGALLCEKMVEAASSSFIIVADDSKLVSGLGGSGLAMPVEVVQFCWKYNLNPIKDGFGAGKEISALEGVVEHGLFLGMATSVIIAGKTGVEIMTK